MILITKNYWYSVAIGVNFGGHGAHAPDNFIKGGAMPHA